MEKKHFLLKLIPPRPTFAENMTEAERNLMQQHVVYWKDLTDKGIAIIFGPVSDPNGAWGLGIIEIEDEDVAHTLTTNDPIIKANLNFSYEIYPMRIGTMRK
ncbi:MAG TPA: YciI family protein [Chitinophagaceae bacterium]|nr:YciI family protein [Chitinophagaceae bacterium]